MRKKLFFIFLTIVVTQLRAQQATIFGSIKDSVGVSIADANIVVLGTKTTALSNDNGTYSIKVPANTSVDLMFSYVGQSPFRVSVATPDIGQKKELNVTMSYTIVLKAFNYVEEQNRDKALPNQH